MTNKIKFIDLFAGIGGFHLAIKKVCNELNKDYECVLVSEIDKYSIDVYTNNFDVKKENIKNVKDVVKNINELNDFDILFAGFPCQTFSNAGNKKGFLDKNKGTLFFDILTILKNKKPKYFVLENVKHLINHNNGETWKNICNSLKELNYVIPTTPLVISPLDIGIKQNRERVFIIGILNDNNKLNDNIFENIKYEITKNKFNQQLDYYLENNIDDKYYIDKNTSKVLFAWNEFIKNVKRVNNKTLPVIWVDEFKSIYDNKTFNLFPKWKQQYIKNIKEIYELNKEFIDSWIDKYNPSQWSKRNKKLEWRAGANHYDIKNTFIQLRQSGIRCSNKDKIPTLVAIVQTPILFDTNKNKFRYLTPKETANFMSIDKSFKLFNEISDHKRKDYYSYKQIGNSINVEVAYRVIKELLKIKVD